VIYTKIITYIITNTTEIYTIYDMLRVSSQESKQSCICMLRVASQESKQSCICMLRVSSQESKQSCICMLRVSSQESKQSCIIQGTFPSLSIFVL
jgi:ferredoxin-thioredoxin reductase catalytic subunit